MMPPSPVACRETGHFKVTSEILNHIRNARLKRALHRRVDVHAAGQVRRLVRDDADRPPARRANPIRIPRVMPMHLQERALIEHRSSRGRCTADWPIPARADPVTHPPPTGLRSRAEAGRPRCCRADIRQLAYQPQALAIVRHGKMGDAADRVVRHRAAEFFLGDLFVRDRLDHVRPGHEHVARAFDHDVEVGDRGRIDGAARARPHDRGDLRDHSRGERVARRRCRRSRRANSTPSGSRATPRSFRPTDRRPCLLIARSNLHDLGGVGFPTATAERGNPARTRRPGGHPRVRPRRPRRRRE